MRTPAARALHLALFLIGVAFYVVFVLPRWWVLTGDIPATVATAGRIAAGIPIAAAAWPVWQILRTSLRSKPPVPEIALRLLAWSAVLHVVAGVLILLAAIVEIWLRLEVGGPWLFGVYGAAGSIAILAFLALYLSFVAAKPPAEPKPPKPKKVKKVKAAKPKAEKKPRGKKRAVKSEAAVEEPAESEAETEADAEADVDADADAATATDAEPHAEADAEADAGAATEADADAEATSAVEPEAVVVIESSDVDEDASDTVTVAITEVAAEPAGASQSPAGSLRNKRPAGKSRRRMSRSPSVTDES